MSYLPPANPYAAAASQYPPAGPPPQVGVAGIAIAALIVSVVAFLGGWIPVLGFILSIVGLVLGIIAIRTSRQIGFGVIAVVLSGFALLTNIVITVLFIVSMAGPSSSSAEDALAKSQEYNAQLQAEQDAQVLEDAKLRQERVSGHSVNTPCYSFDGPEVFINNQSSDATADCVTTLELWGEIAPDGTVMSTGVGTIYGQVSIEPIRLATSETWAATGDLDGIVNYISTDYLPQMGELISLTEPITLGGQPANVSRIDSDAALTKTKAIIVGFAPQSYDTSQGPIQLFVISVVTPYDNGDQLIDSVFASWRWE